MRHCQHPKRPCPADLERRLQLGQNRRRRRGGLLLLHRRRRRWLCRCCHVWRTARRTTKRISDLPQLLRKSSHGGLLLDAHRRQQLPHIDAQLGGRGAEARGGGGAVAHQHLRASGVGMHRCDFRTCAPRSGCMTTTNTPKTLSRLHLVPPSSFLAVWQRVPVDQTPAAGCPA